MGIRKSIKNLGWHFLGYVPVRDEGEIFWVKWGTLGYTYRHVLVNGKSCYGGLNNTFVLRQTDELTIERCEQIVTIAIEIYRKIRDRKTPQKTIIDWMGKMEDEFGGKT